jgi:hypothetical protein
MPATELPFSNVLERSEARAFANVLEAREFANVLAARDVANVLPRSLPPSSLAGPALTLSSSLGCNSASAFI